jgi:fructose-1-phosphate kinase PfkB-like protein
MILPGSDAHILAFLAQKPTLTHAELAELLDELTPRAKSIAIDIVCGLPSHGADAFTEWAESLTKESVACFSDTQQRS